MQQEERRRDEMRRNSMVTANSNNTMAIASSATVKLARHRNFFSLSRVKFLDCLELPEVRIS